MSLQVSQRERGSSEGLYRSVLKVLTLVCLCLVPPETGGESTIELDVLTET